MSLSSLLGFAQLSSLVHLVDCWTVLLACPYLGFRSGLGTAVRGVVSRMTVLGVKAG